MTELLTVLIGFAWIAVLVAIPLALIGLCQKLDIEEWGVLPLILLLGEAVYACYRVGLTVRPWLVEVLR